MESILQELDFENGGNETIRSPKLPNSPPSRKQKALYNLLYRVLFKIARGVVQTNCFEFEV